MWPLRCPLLVESISPWWEIILNPVQNSYIGDLHRGFHAVPFGSCSDDVTAGCNKVVVSPNEVVHQAGCHGTSTSEGGDQVLDSGIHGDGRKTMLILQIDLS